MNRRCFLSGLIALPAVSYFLPPVKGWRPWENDFSTDNLRFEATERYSWGATNVRAFYGTSGDGVALTSAAHPLSSEIFRAALLPVIDKIWSEIYDKHADEWERIFGPEQLTLFDSLSPDSLEEIEIGLQAPADAAGRISLLPETQRVAIQVPGRERPSDPEHSGGLLLPHLFGKGPSR